MERREFLAGGCSRFVHLSGFLLRLGGGEPSEGQCCTICPA